MNVTEPCQEFIAQFAPAERSIRALLLAATGDPHTVEDLMQNVAVDLWRKWPEYQRDRPFRPWALGVARIEILRWRRTLARDRFVLDEKLLDRLVTATDKAAEEADLRLSHLAECLKGVSEYAREVVRLKYAGGLTAKRIAEELGKNLASVEMVLTRTRRALRACIDRKLDES